MNYMIGQPNWLINQFQKGVSLHNSILDCPLCKRCQKGFNQNVKKTDICKSWISFTFTHDPIFAQPIYCLCTFWLWPTTAKKWPLWAYLWDRRMLGMNVVQELVGDVPEADRSQVDSLEGILKKKRRKRQAGAKEDVTRVRMCWGYAAGSGTRWFEN